MGCEKRPKRPRHHPACSVERQGPADKCVGGTADPEAQIQVSAPFEDRPKYKRWIYRAEY
jgi:hypothetical protein